MGRQSIVGPLSQDYGIIIQFVYLGNIYPSPVGVVICTRSIPLRIYHPQCDGLVENFNGTLQAMLPKHAREFGPSWDVHLIQVLFAYQVRPHTSTRESLFCMVYGHDPRLPIETAFSTTCTQYQVDVENYCAELT